MNKKVMFVTLVFILFVSIYGCAQPTTTNATLDVIPPDEIYESFAEIPVRVGPSPTTPDGIPHQQHNQNAPVSMQEALREAASALPGIRFEPTPFSLSGSIGWRLTEVFAKGPDGSFIRQSLEFAHQHVPADGSMHMLLPMNIARAALDKGWGVMHPWTDSISGESSEYVMIFGPRDDSELHTVWIIAQISYYQARGLKIEPMS